MTRCRDHTHDLVIYKEQPGRKDGEEIRGTIEWYDRHALKVHRANEHLGAGAEPGFRE
jgi:hypothetical protein